MRCLDLFAGVGGIRLGMEGAGFHTVFSNDFNKWSRITFDANHSEPKMTFGDVTKIDETTLPEFDVLVGGFPCQAFSSIGARRGFEDKTKGTLFFDMLRIMKHHKPRMALMENVRGLINHEKGETFKTILESLEELGYHVHWKLLKSTTHCNIPQMRTRVFIVSFRDKEDYDRFEFPNEVPLTTSAWDMIELGRKDLDEKLWIKGSILDKIERENGVETLDEGKFYFYRYDRGLNYIRTPDQCPTLVANIGSSQTPFILDSGRLRHLAGRELFRLQGFPEDFILPPEVPHTQIHFQAGNSVTVPLVKRIAEKMMEACEVKRKSRAKAKAV